MTVPECIDQVKNCGTHKLTSAERKVHSIYEYMHTLRLENRFSYTTHSVPLPGTRPALILQAENTYNMYNSDPQKSQSTHSTFIHIKQQPNPKPPPPLTQRYNYVRKNYQTLHRIHILTTICSLWNITQDQNMIILMNGYWQNYRLIPSKTLVKSYKLQTPFRLSTSMEIT